MTKPLILLSLLIFFWYSGKQLAKTTYYLTLVALASSFLGDVFLLFDSISNLYFILGLISFLLAHVIYGMIFLNKWNQKPRWNIHIITLVLVSYGILLFLYLKGGLGALTYPVVLYVLGILFMAITALRRFQKVTKKSFAFVFTGAIFFVISDSILAIHMFKQEILWSSFLIMVTYALAQYLIVKGILSQNKS